MPAIKVNKTTIKKLKKQVTALKRKEKSTRNKLRVALAKAKKMSKTYQRKLKIAAAQASIYVKLANVFKKKSKVKKRK